MKNSLLTIIILCIWNTAGADQLTLMPSQNSWWTFDMFHQSRSLPLGDSFVRAPLNPGYQISYHHNVLGDGALRGAGTVQTGYSQFDQLFWSLHFGGGAEMVWKSNSGFIATYTLSLDYERIFTGTNNFEFDNGRYKQKTDKGRSYMRFTPVDISMGYAPECLKGTGIIPALRFAWLLDLPLYGGDDPTPWSYTQIGLSINWMIGG